MSIDAKCLGNRYGTGNYTGLYYDAVTILKERDEARRLAEELRAKLCGGWDSEWITLPWEVEYRRKS